MLRKKIFILSFFVFSISFSAFCQVQLNSIIRQYLHNIKVCNTPYANSCIYEMEYFNVTQNGKYLKLEYDFAGINSNTVIVDLSKATIQTGKWTRYSQKWDHGGDKSVITIEDSDGMNFIQVGKKNYNQGQKTNIITFICFSFGTEPVANLFLNELLSIQDKYKEKDPWRISPVELPNVAQDVYDINICFNDINSILREYKFKSPHASKSNNNVESTNLYISFEYPYLYLYYTDQYRKGIYYASNSVLGDKFMKTDIRRTSFVQENKYNNYVCFNNDYGLESMEDGAKELLKSFYLTGTELNVKYLCDYLNRFKSLIEQCGFTGHLYGKNNSNLYNNSNQGNNRKKFSKKKSRNRSR